MLRRGAVTELCFPTLDFSVSASLPMQCSGNGSGLVRSSISFTSLVQTASAV